MKQVIELKIVVDSGNAEGIRSHLLSACEVLSNVRGTKADVLQSEVRNLTKTEVSEAKHKRFIQ